MTLHQRLNQMERQIRQQRTGLFVLAAALCGVVSMAAQSTGLTDAEGKKIDSLLGSEQPKADVVFNEIKAKKILIMDEVGRDKVKIHNFAGYGMLSTFGPNGKEIVGLSWFAGEGGGGGVTAYDTNGDRRAEMVATSDGGAVFVNNKTGERMISLQGDGYGNGEVGVWNRKGKGRVWRSQ